MNAPKKDRRQTLLADKIEPFEFPFDAQAWQSFELTRDARNQQKAAWRRLTAMYDELDGSGIGVVGEFGDFDGGLAHLLAEVLELAFEQG